MTAKPLISFLAALTIGLATAAEPSIRISTDHPGGNAIILENTGAAVRLKPDLRGGRDWFYWNFEAAAAEPGVVEFVFEGALRIGVRGPAVSEDGGLNWRWLGADAVRYSDKESKEDPTESFKFEFTQNDQKVRFAVAIPYLQDELDRFLASIDGNPHLELTELTKTRRGKSVELIRVGAPGPDKEAIVVSARHHACESMASYVLEAFLEEALSDSPSAKAFRERYVIYAVPMMDKDGVQAGDQGKWRFPHDHNRDYGIKSIYPEVQAIQKLAKEVNVRLALDFHCPSLRGEIHEVFYFIGVGLPHLRDNTEELKGWITEERPHTVKTGPFNFMRDPPPTAPEVLKDEKFSVWFAYLDGVRFAATFEIPYTQPNCALDAAMAKNYGAALLRAWERSEFVETEGTRSPVGYADLTEFRKTFETTHKSSPDEAEATAKALLGDPASPAHFRVEAEYSLGLLRLRQRRYDEAIAHFEKVLAHPNATTAQRLTAGAKHVVANCQNPDAKIGSIQAAIIRFERTPYLSDGAQLEAYGAVSIYFSEANDPAAALGFAQKQLPAASKIQRGETLNRVAGFYDELSQPDEALSARQAAVAHLREQLDPIPVGVFGPMMARDLFEALQKIPEATLDEKRQAAEIVLNHKIASSKMKDEIRIALDALAP